MATQVSELTEAIKKLNDTLEESTKKGKEAAEKTVNVGKAAASMGAKTGGISSLEQRSFSLGQGLRTVGQGAIGAAGAGSEASAAGSIIGSVGAAAGGPIGAAVGFGAALITASTQLRAFIGSVHEGNMRFAEVSASMAVVQARHEMMQYRIDRQLGEATAGSAAKLSNAINQLDAESVNLRANWKNMQNDFSVGLAIVSSKLQNAFQGILTKVFGYDQKVELGADVNPTTWLTEAGQAAMADAARGRPGGAGRFGGWEWWRPQ